MSTQPFPAQGNQCFLCHRKLSELEPLYAAIEASVRKAKEARILPVRQEIEQVRSKLDTLTKLRGTKGLNVKLYHVSGMTVTENRHQVREIVNELAPHLAPLFDYQWDNYVPPIPGYSDNGSLKLKTTFGDILEPIIAEETKRLSGLESVLKLREADIPANAPHPTLRQVSIELPWPTAASLTETESKHDGYGSPNRSSSPTKVVTVDLCPMCSGLLEQASRAAHHVIADRNAPPDDDDDPPSYSDDHADDNPAEDWQSDSDS